MFKFRRVIVLSVLILCTTSLRVNANSSTISYHPSILSDASGRIMAIWLVSKEDQTFLKSTVCFPDDGWLTPSIVSTEGNNIVSMPSVAINSFGEIVAAWESYSPKLDRSVIEAAFSKTEDGEWSTPFIISGLEEKLNHDIEVSIDDNGHVTAVWCSQSKDKTDEMHVRISVAQHKASWSEPFVLSNN